MLSPFLLQPQLIHGNLVAYQNHGLLFCGEPGSGKSTISYELIQKGGKLVADDIVHIDNDAIGHAPKKGQQKIEIFGIGVITLSAAQYCPSIGISHIFFHKDSPPRLYEKQTLKLGSKDISYSFCNLSHFFTADYVTIFCQQFLNQD
ncbi:MAG: HPr kinase/phosphorylase [Alphaproteobacteria bacterium]